MKKYFQPVRLIGMTLIWMWRSDRLSTLLLTLIPVIGGLIPVIQVLVIAKVVNLLTNRLLQDNVEQVSVFVALSPIISWLAILAGILVLSHLLNGLSPILEERLHYHAKEKIDKPLLTLSTKLPLELLDSTKFHDSASRALQAGSSGMISFFLQSFQVVQVVVTITSLLLFLGSVNWLLAIGMLILLLPYIHYEMKAIQQRNSLLNHQTEEHRKVDYIGELLSSRGSSKEVKLFSLKNHLISTWKEKANHLDQSVLTHERKTLFGEGLWEFIITLTITICQGAIIWIFSIGMISAGIATALFTGVFQLKEAAERMGMALWRAGLQYNQVEHVFTFMDYHDQLMSERKNSFPNPLKHGITCKNLSFIYPNQAKPCLQSINLDIKSGEVIALVGENGSGKTTLAKLLLGLYQPSHGKVSFDGYDSQSMNQEDIYKHMSAVFQDFGKYELSVRENIAFGNLDALDDHKKIEEAMKRADISGILSKLQKGLDTILGRTFDDSEDLSGGQWQKIAAARAFMKKSQFLVLDEPTASLDPKAELDVLEQFMKLAEGKTTLIISHRIGCARLADRVIVMNRGQVVEVGTHEELMRKKEHYADLFSMQAQWYS